MRFYGSQKYLLPSLVAPTIAWEMTGVTAMVLRCQRGRPWWTG